MSAILKLCSNVFYFSLIIFDITKLNKISGRH